MTAKMQKPERMWSKIGSGIFMASFYMTNGSTQHAECMVGGTRGDWSLIVKQYTLGTVSATLTVKRSGIATKNAAMVTAEAIAAEIVV